jgi:hypothetical protein
MLRSSIGRRTSSGTASAAALEIVAPTGKPCKVIRVEVYLVAATASIFGLGRPAAKGITPTSPVNSLSEVNGNELGGILTQTAVAWGTGPTVPVNFFRRVGLPATIGVGVVWDFDGGLWIPANASLVLWNIGTNSLADVNVVADE